MKKITIVGVGALGSHVALFLRNVADLHVIDYDRIEQKNISSQFHGKPNVGKLKASSFQQTMSFLFGLKVQATTNKLVQDNRLQLLAGSDLILDCLDNGEARRIVQSFARSTGTPCLHGALAADGGFGRIIWDEKFEIDDTAAGGATCEDGAHLPFITVVSSLLAKAAQDFILTGVKRGFQVHPGGVFSV
jgi:molybdopterin/thiamine biosynthesis adenylyltransferase